MDFTNPLKLIGGATEVAKTLLTAETVVEKAQLQLQMADVLGALAAARIALIDAEASSREKDEEIVRLHKAREERSELIEGAGGYRWKSDGKGNRVGYPCCPSCLAKQDRQVALVRDGALIQGRCPQCHERFSPVSYWNPPKRDGDPAIEEAPAAPSIMTFGELGDKLNGY